MKKAKLYSAAFLGYSPAVYPSSEKFGISQFHPHL
jgi:hypothetical protein